MTALELEFRALYEWAQAEGHRNAEAWLKSACEPDLPTEFHSAFRFWRSLSGASREFMLALARGHKRHKAFHEPSKHQHWKPSR